jgi:hypothetical protein
LDPPALSGTTDAVARRFKGYSSGLGTAVPSGNGINLAAGGRMSLPLLLAQVLPLDR